MSIGAIYSYYGSKEELFRAVVERTFASRVTTITAEREGGLRSPSELVRAVIAGMEGEAVLAIAPQIWAEAAVEPETRVAVARVFERLGDLLGAELAAWAAEHPERVEGDPGAWAARVAPVLVSVIPGFIVQRLTVPGFDEKTYLDALTDAFGC